MATYNNNKNMTYYQLSLVDGNNVLMRSNVFGSELQFQQFLNRIQLGNVHYVVNYVTQAPQSLNEFQGNAVRRGSYNPFNYSYYTPPTGTETSFDTSPTQYYETSPMQHHGTSPTQYHPQYHVDFNSSPEPIHGTSPQRCNHSPWPDYFNTQPVATSTPKSNVNLEVVGNSIGTSASPIDDTWEHLGEQAYSGFQIKERPEGVGYLLMPSGNCNFTGSNIGNSVWLEQYNAWSVDEDDLDYYLDQGATWHLEVDSVNRLLDEMDDRPIFDDMIFEQYGDSYLVQCYEDHPNYPDSTFHGGIWNKDADGWVFPSNMRGFLEDNGCEFEDNTSILFEDMEYRPCRGRGFKLTPSSESRFYGVDNFAGKGLWRKTYWFFPKSSHQFFISRGATLAE